MKDITQYRAWLTLIQLPDLGKIKLKALLNALGSAEAILDASEEKLRSIDGIGPMAARSIINWRELTNTDDELRLIEKHDVNLVSILDENYPENLARCAAPPPLIYYKGTLDVIDRAAVAVIGARKMSRYGRRAATEITRDLAEAGVTIVSGLALGVDSVAHEAALDRGGRTLAVQGRGLADVYPAQHKVLAHKITESGALISEKPMATKPDAGSFPERNAIIAGLSLGTLVIEAGKRSGTSITVGQALDENRAAFAVPGDIFRSASVGTNRMLRDGAQVATCANDILLALRDELKNSLEGLPQLSDPDGDEPKPLPKDLGSVELRIMQALDVDELTIDELADKLAGDEEGSVATGPLMGALLTLELRGILRQEPGKRFRKA
jgi:DNA processing protein